MRYGDDCILSQAALVFFFSLKLALSFVSGPVRGMRSKKKENLQERNWARDEVVGGV